MNEENIKDISKEERMSRVNPPITFNNLPFKERTAIELKYLGRSYKEISERLENTVTETVAGWFTQRGKLASLYQDYVIMMNEKRQEEMEKKIALTDDEVFVVTTNIWRKLGQRIQGRKIPVYDKNGQPVLDKDGKQLMMNDELDVDVSDAERAWKIQRIMRGLPTAYEKQEIEQTNFEMDMIIKELGLTDEDFEDANIGETTKKIRTYLANQ